MGQHSDDHHSLEEVISNQSSLIQKMKAYHEKELQETIQIYELKLKSAADLAAQNDYRKFDFRLTYRNSRASRSNSKSESKSV